MNIGITLFLVISILISTNANSEQSAEDIIKNRKAIFSKTIVLLKKFNHSHQVGILMEQKN